MTSPSNGAAAPAAAGLPARLRRAWAAAGAPVWLLWIVGGIVICALYLFMSEGNQNLVYAGVAVATPCAIVFGISRYRPRHRAWALVALGAGLMAGGEIAWIVSAEDGISGLADAQYLLGYVAMCGAMVIFARRHSAGIGSILDACILTAAAASILDVGHRAHPRRRLGRSRGGPDSTAYPLLDIVMIGLLLRILLDIGCRSSVLLFASGVGMYLISDLIYSVLAIAGTYTVGPLDFGWSHGLHAVGRGRAPSNDGCGRGTGACRRTTLHRRLAALAVVSLVPLLIAVAEQLRPAAPSSRCRPSSPRP